MCWDLNNMHEKVKTIPVNSIADEFGAGVSILKASIEDSNSIEGLEKLNKTFLK